MVKMNMFPLMLLHHENAGEEIKRDAIQIDLIFLALSHQINPLSVIVIISFLGTGGVFNWCANDTSG